MSRSKEFNLIDDQRHPIHTILMLVWPIVLEQLLVTLVQSVDTAMVGSLGAAATASVSISQSPMFLINGVMMAFGTGFTVLIARSVGARDFVRARSLIRQAMTTILLLGVPVALICFALSYHIPLWMGAEPDVLALAARYNRIMAIGVLFRGMTMVLTAIYRGFGDSRTPMYINMGVNAVNVIGNYLLIYPTHTVELPGRGYTVWGAGWGVAGAAAASAGSIILGALLLLVITIRRPSPMQISLREDFRLRPDDLRDVFRLSLPAMFERFTMSGASIVIASTVASLGTVAIAANSLASTGESFCYMPAFAFGTAATTLMSQALGAQRPDLAEKYIRECVRLGSALMGVLCSILFLFAPRIIDLFTNDGEVIAIAGVLLRILATIEIPYLIALVHAGALRGAGDTRSVFVITLISMWGVRVLGAVACVHLLGLGVYSVCVCMCTDNVTRMLMFAWKYHRGEWKAIASAAPACDGKNCA